MNYKLKYWLTTVVFAYLLFATVILMATLQEILKTKSFNVTYDLDVAHPFLFFGSIFITASFVGLLMALECKPYEFIFKYKTEEQKQNILDKLNNFTINNKKEIGQFKRDIKEVNGNIINYVTKYKYVNMYLPKIQMTIEDEKIIVSAPAYYITMIKQL